MPTKTSCSRIVTYLKKGPAGPQGSVGRLPVPYGTYGEQSSYTCTDRIAPVIMHNNLYYVMNKNVTWYVANNVTPAQDYANNGSNATWIYMQNYKAIFAEVFMANFGKIASAVFYGNLMFSQQGIVSGAASSNYSELHTDSNGDVDESQASYFKPNFWINFANGKMKALSGSVGGWNMTASRLHSGSGTGFVGLDSNTSNTYTFWAGAADGANAPFSVTRAGAIKSTSGSIGGFSITGSSIGTTSTAYGQAYTGIQHGRIFLQNSTSSTGVRSIELNAAGGSSKIRIYSDYDFDPGLYVGGKIGVAIWAETGVFAGLRPQTNYLTASDFPYTLRWDDFNVFIHNTSDVTLTLPSNPPKGQTYHIIKTGGSKLKINCNGSSLWWKGSNYSNTFDLTSNNALIVLFRYSTNAWVASVHIED